MKKIALTLTLALALILSGTNLFAQKSYSSQGYGHTLNLGLGIGGYGYSHHYYDHSLPVFSINYEFDVARNFTLAPFITFMTYRYNDKYYRQSIIPIGVKGSYYLDQVLGAGPDWDFYLAGSLGFALVRTTWYDGHSGDTYYDGGASPLFLDLHLGTEYHLSNKLGLFLDLSTGISTIGLAFH